MLHGIEAPATVPEGANGSVEISASRSTDITVSNPRTGELINLKVGPSGKVRFEMPANWVAGDILAVVDNNDPTAGALIQVVPASAIHASSTSTDRLS